ncbi:MAG: hypothetical protein HY819_00665 [Acidobacteria bacterium]|nr:hypothetical protein [Acidobacteriota bacterium]
MPQNWTEIRNTFSPQESVPPHQLDKWFVERLNSPIDTFVELLSPNTNPERHILVGQPASGKSSELTKLAAELKKQHDSLVVRFDLVNNLDVERANPIEIIFLMGAAIFKSATLELPSATQPDRSLLDELQKGLESIVHTYTDNKEFSLDLNKLLEGLVVFSGATFAGAVGAVAVKGIYDKLKDNFRFVSSTNTQIARKLEVEPSVEVLIQILNKIIDDVHFKSNRSVVVLMDGLDKLRDLEVIETNFLNNKFLNGPKCHIVYTGPLDLYYSPAFGEVRSRFNIVPFAHIKLHDRGDSNLTYPDGFSFMKKVVERRLNSLHLEMNDIIEPMALNTIIKGSGGVMRDFIRLIQSAALQAQVAKKEKIEIQEAVKVLNELRRQLKAQLTPDYEEILDEVRHTNRRVADKDGRGDKCDLMLRNDLVLNYVNDDIWFDVHSALTNEPWKIPT